MAVTYQMKAPTGGAPMPPLPRHAPEQAERRPPPIAGVRALLAPDGIDSDEPQMETFAHMETVTLLLVSLYWLWRDRHDFFAASNLTIYYSPTQLKSQDFRGPDFFVVLGTHREPKRRSWVVWDEGGKYPNVIVEALSSSTADVDRGLKKQIYQDVFHTPEYFLFDPETKELAGYRLAGGKYQPIAPDPAGCLLSKELELLLGVHEGLLRLFLPSGELVPIPNELGLKAEAEAERARSAEQRAQSAEQRAESAEAEARHARLYAEKLRALGIDPDA
jgi:Uma2 family endonuclease